MSTLERSSWNDSSPKSKPMGWLMIRLSWQSNHWPLWGPSSTKSWIRSRATQYMGIRRPLTIIRVLEPLKCFSRWITSRRSCLRILPTRASMRPWPVLVSCHHQTSRNLQPTSVKSARVAKRRVSNCHQPPNSNPLHGHPRQGHPPKSCNVTCKARHMMLLSNRRKASATGTPW